MRFDALLIVAFFKAGAPSRRTTTTSASFLLHRREHGHRRHRGLGIGGIGVWALFHVWAATLIKSCSSCRQMAVVRQVYDSTASTHRRLHPHQPRRSRRPADRHGRIRWPSRPRRCSSRADDLKQVIDRNWCGCGGLLLLMCIVIYSFGSRLIRLCYQPNQDRLHPSKPTRRSRGRPRCSAAVVLGMWQPELATDHHRNRRYEIW